MSDISIDPVTVFEILLLIGSPGLLLGAILGALWRGHRIAGALLGAVAGFALCLTGWTVFNA